MKEEIIFIVSPVLCLWYGYYNNCNIGFVYHILVKGKKVKFSPLQALEALRVVRG
jgi:hypothetical protein